MTRQCVCVITKHALTAFSLKREQRQTTEGIHKKFLLQLTRCGRFYKEEDRTREWQLSKRNRHTRNSLVTPRCIHSHKYYKKHVRSSFYSTSNGEHWLTGSCVHCDVTNNTSITSLALDFTPYDSTRLKKPLFFFSPIIYAAK